MTPTATPRDFGTATKWIATSGRSQAMELRRKESVQFRRFEHVLPFTRC